MKKTILYPLAALALLFTACTKPDIKSDFNISWDDFNFDLGPGSVNTISNRFDSSAFSYINIPLLKKYIYKDSATGITDSLYSHPMQDYVFVPSVTGDPSKPGYYYHVYDLKLSNYWAYNPELVFFKGRASCDLDYKNTQTFIDSNFILTNEHTGLAAFWYPFVSSGNQQYSFIPSLSIGSNVYNDAHCFFSSNGLQPTDTNYQGTIFYWVKGIGIIKKEIRTYNSVKTSLLVRFG